MDEIEEKERTAKDWAKIILVRILKAAFWGFIMGGEIMLFLNITQIGSQFFPAQQSGLMEILMISVGFEVAIQLLQGTIFPFILSIARAFLFMVLLVHVTNGGVMEIQIQSSQELPLPSGMNIVITLDFKPILGAFLILSSLSIIKILLQLIEFLSEKEEPMVPPESS